MDLFAAPNSAIKSKGVELCAIAVPITAVSTVITEQNIQKHLLKYINSHKTATIVAAITAIAMEFNTPAFNCRAGTTPQMYNE